MSRFKALNIYPWSIWLFCAFSFVSLKNYGFSNVAGYITFLSEVVCDVLITGVCILILRSVKVQHKCFFKLQLVSFVFSIVADGSFNLFINIIGIKVSNLQYAVFDIPFFCFLFFQMISWHTLLKSCLPNKHKINYPFFILSLVLFLTFIMGINWNIAVFSFQGILNIFETLIESLSFLFITYILICTDLSWLRKIGFGHLIVISSDFIIRNSFVNDNVLISNPAEIFWVLGLILHGAGMFEYYFFPKKITLKKINQVQPIFSVVLLLFSLTLILIFYFIIMVFLPNLNSQLLSSGHAISALVVILTIISISLSIYISDLLSDNIKELKALNDGKILELPNQVRNKGIKISEFTEVKNIIFSSFEMKNTLLKQEKKLTEKMLRGAHDIRSPISSLECLLENKDNLDLKILPSIALEIKEIANDLLASLRDTSIQKNVEAHSLNEFLESLSLIADDFSLKFKNIRFEKQIHIDKKTDNYFLFYNVKELKRALSNILNNAVESYCIGLKTTVVVRAELRKDNFFYVSIIDNGKGVPKELINDIFKERFTYNKNKGSGIGLSYVVDVIDNWKAKYEFSSIEDKGSTFQFIFKCLEKLPEKTNGKYVLIDDKESVRQAWALKASINDINLKTFKSKEDFLKEISKFPKSTTIYIDYDLKTEKSGLDLGNYLFKIGYQNIYITTGYSTLTEAGEYWQDKIIGKYPPF